MPYPFAVAISRRETVRPIQPMAAALLHLTAFLAHDPIPVEMIEKGARHIEEATVLLGDEFGHRVEPQPVWSVLAELAGASLIRRQDEETFTVHRIVQTSLRDQIPAGHQRDWITIALRIVDGAAAGDPEDIRSWPAWNLLSPHALRVVALADEAGMAEPASRLMNQLGLLFWRQGRYQEAEPLLRRALALDEALVGADHTQLATRLNNLAQLFQDTDRLGEAELLMRRALEIWERTLGPRHPHVATALNNLAQLLQATVRQWDAEPMMRRALAIDEAAFGPEHPHVARDLNNLALFLQDTSRRSEAEPLMRRALALFETILGPGHPSTQTVRDNLEVLLIELG
jgi:tetratricopeptide (TPR) repeat protein